MTNQITEKSYSLVPDVDDDAVYTIQIEHEPYKGVIVQYLKIGLNVTDDGEHAKLSFHYSIRDCPDTIDKQQLEQDKDFHNFLGDLLAYIIQSAFDSGNYKIGDPKPSKSDPIDVDSTAIDDSPEDRQ